MFIVQKSRIFVSVMMSLKCDMLSVLVMLCGCALLVACTDEFSLPDDSEGVSHTVIVWMGAENSLAAYSIGDLQEMHDAVGDIPEDCRVVVYRDAQFAPSVYLLSHGKYSVWKEYENDEDSADSAVVVRRMQDLVESFPSKSYSLVIWSHGTGWSRSPNRSVIVDNGSNVTSPPQANFGTWLDLGQLEGVLSHLPHLEFLMFDACFMQTIEVAVQLYPYTDYIIASPAEIPANGAPYDRIMGSMCKADVGGILQGYADAYPDAKGVLLSAVRSSEVPGLCSVTRQVIASQFRREEMPDVSSAQVYAPAYGSGEAGQRMLPVPYDMRSVMHSVMTDGQYVSWVRQWERAVPYVNSASAWDSQYSSVYFGSRHNHMTDADNYGGISMYVPSASYDAPGWNREFRSLRCYGMMSWQQTGW